VQFYTGGTVTLSGIGPSGYFVVHTFTASGTLAPTTATGRRGTKSTRQ
jgi:hypothetical protein